MNLSEEMRLSREAGEFIHSIANMIDSSDIKINGLSLERIEMFTELSEALRTMSPLDDSAPRLYEMGFTLSDYPRSAWIELAHLLFISDDKSSFQDIVSRIRI